jgi:hypothetical protein
MSEGHQDNKITPTDENLEQDFRVRHDEDLELTNSCWGMTKFFFGQSYKDVGRRKCNFCLAFCSVFIVVLSTLIITTVVNFGPIIFLKLGEAKHG